MKKSLLAAAAFLVALPLAAADITIHGSSTMSELNKAASTEFEKANPGTKVLVTTTDSSQGIADLIAGKTGIAASSRPIKPEESAKLKSIVGLPVARDGVVIYVHPSNKVDSVTLEQLTGIFSGKIKNWKELGGADSPIDVYVREPESGTAEFFREHVLGSKTAAYGPGAKEANGSGAILNAVAKDPKAIGYAGAFFTQSAKSLSIRKTAGGPAIAPTREAVMKGDYPLARVLYYYLAEQPKGELLHFTQWVLSPAGQQIVAKAGYFPAR